MERSFETVRVDDKGDGLTLLTLNRPQVANAMNTQMGRDLLAFFDAINADPLAHRAIVVTGAGDKAFCAGGTQNLPRAVGERRAKEIILTGRPFSANEAFDWGLVNRVCTPDQLLDETLETARGIADNAPISVRQAKHAIHYGLQMDLASALMLEIEAYNRMVPTEDRREGIASFNEKRKPRFKGR